MKHGDSADCGSTYTVDEATRTAVCPHCGTRFERCLDAWPRGAIVRYTAKALKSLSGKVAAGPPLTAGSWAQRTAARGRSCSGVAASSGPSRRARSKGGPRENVEPGSLPSRERATQVQLCRDDPPRDVHASRARVRGDPLPWGESGTVSGRVRRLHRNLYALRDPSQRRTGRRLPFAVAHVNVERRRPGSGFGFRATSSRRSSSSGAKDRITRRRERLTGEGTARRFRKGVARRTLPPTLEPGSFPDDSGGRVGGACGDGAAKRGTR